MDISNNSNISEDLGNTKPSPTRNSSNKRLRKAIFVLNNYSEEEYNSITQDFDRCEYKYVIGKEIGEEGTPHLQGYVEFKKQVYFSTLKKINHRIHWEPAKGNRQQNITYCTKDNTYISTFPLSREARILKSYDNVEWKQWQQNVIDIVESKADDRSIHWFHEPNGNTGKSFLAKYLYLKYNCIIADGKKDNVFNQVNMWLQKHPEDDPKIILLDIPRYNKDYINYGTLEKLKDGLIYSGKYEGGVCIFDAPHVIVFSNSEPEYKKLSLDRWKVKIII